MTPTDLLDFNIEFSTRIYDDVYRFKLDKLKPIVYNLFKNKEHRDIQYFGEYDSTVYSPNTYVELNKKSHLEKL